YLRAFAASLDAAALGLARGVWQRGGVGSTPRPDGRRPRRRSALVVCHPRVMMTECFSSFPRKRESRDVSRLPWAPAFAGRRVICGDTNEFQLSLRPDRTAPRG